MGVDSGLIIGVIFQGVNTILVIALLVIMMRLGLLGIEALKIYIRKNKE